MKRFLCFSILCLGLIINATSQEQKPEVLLSKAVYEEEVNGDLDEAIKTYQSVVQKYPDNRKVSAEALLHLGSCYEKIGSPNAYDTYQELINKYAEQEDEVAIALARVNYLDAYAADLNEKAEKHLSDGHELYKRWEYASAVKEYEDAVKLKPNTLIARNAQYYIGQSYFKAGLYEDALATFENLIEENPESTIAPVTELMIAQVKYEQEKNKNLKNITSYASDDGVIIDPNTDIKYTEINTFTGKRDVIEYTTGLDLSPNGKFLLNGNLIVPFSGGDPFELVNIPAGRGTWSPNGKMVAFYSNDAIWVVPVSPETGQSTGPRPLCEQRGRFPAPPDRLRPRRPDPASCRQPA